VLSICVEVCSAAFYIDDDPGVLISACLFGDGAGAAVLGEGVQNGNRPIRWMRGTTVTNPGVRDLLRFEQRSGMLRNLLSPRVPALAAEYVGTVVDDLLAAEKLRLQDIAGWVVHPGGRDVLTALRDRLKLGATDLRWSEKVLREYGNLSSASVYFVLAEALRDCGPRGVWLLSSFGAGFSCHGALLAVE
jgi:alkylresorcinol/alkylpyrone synthase